jgi:hypothetical protein
VEEPLLPRLEAAFARMHALLGDARLGASLRAEASASFAGWSSLKLARDELVVQVKARSAQAPAAVASDLALHERASDVAAAANVSAVSHAAGLALAVAQRSTATARRCARAVARAHDRVTAARAALSGMGQATDGTHSWAEEDEAAAKAAIKRVSEHGLAVLAALKLAAHTTTSAMAAARARILAPARAQGPAVPAARAAASESSAAAPAAVPDSAGGQRQ